MTATGPTEVDVLKQALNKSRAETKRITDMYLRLERDMSNLSLSKTDIEKLLTLLTWDSDTGMWQTGEEGDDHITYCFKQYLGKQV